MLTNQPTSLSTTVRCLPTSKQVRGHQQQHLMNIWLGFIAAAGAVDDLTHLAVTLAISGHIPPQTTHKHSTLCYNLAIHKELHSDNTYKKKPLNLQILHKCPAVIP